MPPQFSGSQGLPRPRALSRLSRAVRWLAPAVAIAVSPLTVASGSFYDDGALLINITQADLNRVLASGFEGGSRVVEGGAERIGKGVEGLSYRADLSAPRLTLGDNGRAWLRMQILEADVQIERFERKFALCENLGVAIDRERPVEVGIELAFSIVDRDLSVSPDNVWLLDARKGFRLIRPSRCSKSLLPRWLLWWLGKPYLRRYIDRLDELLLAEARDGAASLAGDQGLARRQWSIVSADPELPPLEFHLYPHRLDTSQGALFVRFAGSTTGDQAVRPGPEPAVGPTADRSFVALSEGFANALLGLTLNNVAALPLRPGSDAARLLREGRGRALVPGLAGEEVRELAFAVRFLTPPKLAFDAVPGEGQRALIRLSFTDVEIELRDEGAPGGRSLGIVVLEAGELSVVPYLSVLGGISLELIDNDWLVSSSGIEVNERLLAAAIQELVFSRMFRTRYEPLARGDVHIGDSDVEPRYFSVEGSYLVIDTDFGTCAPSEGTPCPAATPTSVSHAKR